MYIEAKVLGGEGIEDTCRRALALATRIGCDVHFKFNDVNCMAIQGHDPKDLIASWWEAVDSKTCHKIAVSHPRPRPVPSAS
jgi:hypothetical protein